MNVITRSLKPGERSLPGELRARWGRGTQYFGRERLMQGMHGLSACDPEDPFCVDVPGTDPGMPVISQPIYDTPVLFDPGQLQVQFDPTQLGIPPSITTPPPDYQGPTKLPANTTPPSAPSGYQWANVVNSSGQTLAKILAISQGGSSVDLPNGAHLVYGSVPSSVAGSQAGGGMLGSGYNQTAISGSLNMNTLLMMGLGLGALFLFMRR